MWVQLNPLFPGGLYGNSAPLPWEAAKASSVLLRLCNPLSTSSCTDDLKDWALLVMVVIYLLDLVSWTQDLSHVLYDWAAKLFQLQFSNFDSQRGVGRGREWEEIHPETTFHGETHHFTFWYCPRCDLADYQRGWGSNPGPHGWHVKGNSFVRSSSIQHPSPPPSSSRIIVKMSSLMSVKYALIK